MARGNPALLAFNRGLISPKALARVDLERTRLSAEVYRNWLPKTQGAMRLRPGTKHLGSSYSDTGAEWIEFVAATDDTALVELTHQKMRVWIDDELLERPHVDTTVTLSDTGWSSTSSGGAISSGSAVDVLPTFTANTTDGVTITPSSEDTLYFNIFGGFFVNYSAWKAADDNSASWWQDTGPESASTLPSTFQIDFGSGNSQAITSYALRAATGGSVNYMPSTWQFQRSDDGSSWTTEDTQGSETFSSGQSKTYSYGDTGTVEARRYWRWNFTASPNSKDLRVAEVEMFTAASASQVRTQGGKRVLNATSIGALARAEKRVIVDTGDYDVEHSLAIQIERGPVTLRVGSTQRDDDYISETRLGTGYHNLAFTPTSNFWITLQSSEIVDRIVSSLTIGDTGTVNVTTHFDANDLSSIRYDQSADVIYLDADGVEPHKIERRGTGRSWSFVEYEPTSGPFLPSASSGAKLSVSHKYGNTTMNSDMPFFRVEHANPPGALFRLFHSGQSGLWPLGALDAKTDAIEVTGITDTGDDGDTGDTDTGGTSQGSERRLDVSVTGTYTGTVVIERSFDGPDYGFHPVSTSGGGLIGGDADDTGTFVRTVNDKDDNSKVWYRARMKAWTSGAALVKITYRSGGVFGIGRVTNFNSNTDVDIEVLIRFSDTGATDSWQEGSWSDVQGYPSSVALHGGRLGHAGGATIYLSVSDDYENFDEETEGDAAPIIKTLGAGPVDNVHYLISLLRLIIGTSGSEIALRSSSLDEPATPTNSNARGFSTQGSSNLRALKMDTNGIFVQRSEKRAFLIGFGQSVDALGDYETSELTLLVPDLLKEGVVSLAIQRQPDTRIHFVLGDGTVAILTYEPKQDVICWSTWTTDGWVEKAMVLPGLGEDKVYYHVRRTINGITKRYLERWATEAESEGDTGLSWLADCAASYTDTGRATVLTGFSHLAGESVVVWGDDTGQSAPGRDYSPDVAGVQTTYTVDTGAGTVTLGTAVHHAVAGLPYTADWRSTKLAYAAEAGTALAQMKRTDKIAFVLYNAHNNGLFFGNDTGTLDALPRMIDGGAEVNPKKIFSTFDKAAMPFPGTWDTDSRIHLRAKAPRPMTVLAAVPTLQTNERV